MIRHGSPLPSRITNANRCSSRISSPCPLAPASRQSAQASRARPTSARGSQAFVHQRARAPTAGRTAYSSPLQHVPLRHNAQSVARTTHDQQRRAQNRLTCTSSLVVPARAVVHVDVPRKQDKLLTRERLTVVEVVLSVRSLLVLLAATIALRKSAASRSEAAPSGSQSGRPGTRAARPRCSYRARRPAVLIGHRGAIGCLRGLTGVRLSQSVFGNGNYPTGGLNPSQPSFRKACLCERLR